MKAPFFRGKSGLHPQSWLPFVVAGAFLLGQGQGRAIEPPPGSEILRELRAFRELGSVLYIAAHPDDENTQLIAYLARSRYYRTAYLSLTRGDGGQNVIGPELGEELGVIRTQELLAARRLDGGQQFFSRAIDFGFSKDYRETLSIWDRRQVLADIVRVIRTFQPDVLITRFSPEPGGTHGHHTASAVLAVEAFKLAGDPRAFPEQLGELTPWQPKRILLNGFGRGPDGATNEAVLRLDVGEDNPQAGISVAEIAARSRSMHKTQGFGNFVGAGNRGTRPETFRLLAGEPATKDILDGVDRTWGRVPGGGEIGAMVDGVLAQFDTNKPAASLPALMAMRGRLNTLTKDRLVEEKRRQLDRIVRDCLGLRVETRVPEAEIVPGEALKLRHRAIVRSDYPARWLGVRYPGIGRGLDEAIALRPSQAASREAAQTLPANTPLSQPYWLREEAATGMYRVDNAALIGRPENPPVFPVEQIFEIDGQRLTIPDEPMQVTLDPVKGEIRRRLDVIPPVSLRFLTPIALFSPGAAHAVSVEVTALRAGRDGTLELEAPTGWGIAPASQEFWLANVGDHARFSFTVTPPAQPATARIGAHARIGDVAYASQRVEIRHDHIPVQVLEPSARLKAISLDLAIRGHQVGYLPGAGDRVAESLEQMGYAVTLLTGADLTPARLRGFDAVVIGIRAFNVRTDLVAGLPALFAYVQEGGNVVAQYNNPNGLKTNQVAPFELRLSQDRVTDENAAVTFLAPDHPALTTPNRITSADFDGWVQERGVYFPNQWNEQFTPILACGDPGEARLKGGLLVARYGRGYFVYTGFAWFRQLPAGVPGAYRLFANLVSLGKEPSEH